MLHHDPNSLHARNLTQINLGGHRHALFFGSDCNGMNDQKQGRFVENFIYKHFSTAQRNKMYGISNSSRLGGLAKSGMKTGMRRFAPLAVGLGMMEFANAQTTGEKASAVGSTSGAIAGAAAGAAIGSIVPGIGTAIGGLVGGLLGEMAGRKVAEGVTSESTETQKGMLGVLEQIDRKLEKQTMAINDLGGNI